MRPVLLLLPMCFALTTTFAANHATSGHKAAPAHVADTHEKGHWSYHGETGPAHWAELDPAFAACAAGRQQSPINIEKAFTQSLDSLQVKYQPTKLSVFNNGHTLQHAVEAGNFLEIGQDRYQLLQFHFHTPSEEAIGGKRFAMDVHMVHRNEAGQLAVLTVLVEQGKKDYPLFNTLWGSLPEENETRIFDKKLFSPAAILPENMNYWTFAGSLTTPPCTEGVRWLVLKTPIQLSKKQIDRFRHLYLMNARPVQALNERAVLTQ